MLDAPCGQFWEFKNSRGPGHTEAPQNCEIYLQELRQVPTVGIRVRFSPTPGRGRKKKKNRFEVGQSTLLFLTRPVLGRKKPATLSLTCCHNVRVWLTWGKGNSQFQSTVATLGYLSGEKKGRYFCKFPVQRHSLTKNWNLILGL